MSGLANANTSVPTSTGQGQGFAQVLGVSTFDPITYLENFNKQSLEIEKQKAKDALEAKAKWNKVPRPKYDTINTFNKQEMDNAIDQYEGIIAEAFASGLDPESRDFKAALEKAQAEITYNNELGQQVTSLLDKRFQQAQSTDPSKWEDYYKGLEAQPTIADRYKYLTSNDPFKKPFNKLEMMKKILPPEKISEILLRGNMTKTVTALDRGQVEAVFDAALIDPSYQSDLQSYYEDGLENGQWNDPDTFKKVFVDEMMNLGKSATQLQGAAQSLARGGDFNINIGGAGRFGDVEIVPAGLEIPDESKKRSDTNLEDADLKEAGKNLAGIKKIADSRLLNTGGADVSNGVFVLNYDTNKQFFEGNFTTVDGTSVTGRPTGLKFTQDGSLWARMKDGELIPIVINEEVITLDGVKQKADANLKMLLNSMGNAEAQKVKEFIYQAKGGKNTSTTTETKEKSTTSKKKKPY